MNFHVITSISPNTVADDYWVTLKILFQPWKWVKGSAISKVEQWFREKFHMRYAVTFNAGRSALFTLLKTSDIGEGDEVLLQAFTCVVVPNCIRWVGAKPVYVDIDNALNLDIDDAKKKITPKTKVLIVQHTFGIPAQMDKIKEFCQKNKLILIEDCAHALGARYKGKLIGTFGDAAFFSFGRDKIVSSVFGGIAITNNPNIGTKITQYKDRLSFPGLFWIFEQLLYPLISFLIIKSYDFLFLGKIVHFLSKRLGLLSLPVYKDEIKGQQPTQFPKKYPNAFAVLCFHQLQKLDSMITARQQHAEQYFRLLKNSSFTLPTKVSGSVYLVFNLLTAKVRELRHLAWKKKIALGNWYSNLIDPKGVDWEQLGYQRGSCPQAEQYASQSLNLPTYSRLQHDDIERICVFLLRNDKK